MRRLLLPAALLGLSAGCHVIGRCEGDACVDAAAETDADADADADADTDVGHGDTSIGLAFVVGDWQTDAGSFVGGHMGALVTNQDMEPVCSSLAEWSESGVAPAGCPECQWAFTLTLSAATATGDACASLALPGEAEEGVEMSLGYSSGYEYDYNGVIYAVTGPVLWYYSDTYGWGALALSGLSGTAEDLRFSVFSGYVYYY